MLMTPFPTCFAAFAYIYGVNVGSRVLVVMYHVDCTLCLYTSIGCYILLILPLLYFWVTVSVHLIFLHGC